MAAIEELLEEAKNNDQKNQKKKSKGKRKIAIAPIEKKTSRQVTFSKRRAGLFKKASELCFLCGADVAVIAFSGAGKLFSFGHPSADNVILRYINSSCSSSSCSSEEGKDVISCMAAEKKKEEKKKKKSMSLTSGFWWNEPIDEGLGLEELEQLKVALEGLRNRVFSRLYEINSNNNNYGNDNNNVVDQQQIIDFGSIDNWNNYPSQAGGYGYEFGPTNVASSSSWHGVRSSSQ